MSYVEKNENYSLIDVLDNDLKNKLVDFWKTTPCSSIEQFPGFPESSDIKSKIYYYIHEINNQIQCYTILKIKKHLIGEIVFGPICKSEVNLDLFFQKLCNEPRFKRIARIRVIPPKFFPYINKGKFENYYFNWATINVNLCNKSLQELISTFSSHHKRNIKKGQQQNIYARLLLQNELANYSLGFQKMLKQRKIKNEMSSYSSLSLIYNFLTTTKTGFFLGVFSKDSQLIGGAIIVQNGDEFFYYSGYSDPEFRSYPTMYVGFLEIMSLGIQSNIKYFDLGGMSLNPDSQTKEINRFKSGFNGEIFQHANSFSITQNTFLNSILNLLKIK